jgi:hypothetical protein
MDENSTNELVARLRDDGDNLRQVEREARIILYALTTEAADAIERLTRERDEARLALTWEQRHAMDMVAEAKARITKLEAALKYYTGDYEPGLSRPNEGPWGASSDDYGTIARAALRDIT